MSLLVKNIANFILDNYTDTETLKQILMDTFKIEKIETVANSFRFWHKGFLYNIVYHPDTVHVSKCYNSTTFGRVKEFTKIFTKEN